MLKYSKKMTGHVIISGTIKTVLDERCSMQQRDTQHGFTLLELIIVIVAIIIFVVVILSLQ